MHQTVHWAVCLHLEHGVNLFVINDQSLSVPLPTFAEHSSIKIFSDVAHGSINAQKNECAEMRKFENFKKSQPPLKKWYMVYGI